MDYGFDKINGVEVVRQIREFNPDVPIYLLTGEFDAERKFGSTPGLTRILRKDSDLLKEIESLLQQ